MQDVMNEAPTLSTPRLHLRNARPDDADYFTVLLASPEMHRWMPQSDPWTPGAVWAVTIDETVIGRAALSLDGELDYWLSRVHWGRGLATEAVGAITAWAFDTVGFDLLRAAVHRDNRGSLRVLEKLGFRFVGLRWIAMPGNRLPWPVCQFAKARGSWLAQC